MECRRPRGCDERGAFFVGATFRPASRCADMLGTILIVILLLALFGSGIGWNGGAPFHFYGGGYPLGGGLGIVLVIVVVLLLIGRI